MDPKEKPKDLLTLGPDLGNGDRPFIRKDTEDKISIGTMHPIQDGEPLPENAVSLRRIDGSMFEVEQIHKGPSRAVSDDYRGGWDRIFGGKQSVGIA